MSYNYRPRRAQYGRFTRTRTSPRKNNYGHSGQYIDPNRFIKPATMVEAEAYEPKNDFEDFGFNPLLVGNLVAKGYKTPSPIQDQAIPAAISGQDVIGIAGTGTGKTAAFALPILQKLMASPMSGALIVAPTRELAQQIEGECRVLGKGSGLFSALLIGGSSMGLQLRDLRARPRIVIGTPGRIKDHVRRGTLKLQGFNIVVLDEVDRMLDMGFVNDVTEIMNQTSNSRQSLFFSATIDARVKRLIDAFSKNPVTIAIKAGVASGNVHQDVVRYTDSSDKFVKLHSLLAEEKVAKAIVFDETQRSVEKLHKLLADQGFLAEAIHGGRSQGQRQRALARFKRSEVNVLVATDVAARGIDVADVTHVINYSTPKAYEDYVHRIGRAGRAGRVGYAFTFVTASQGR